MSNPLQRLKYFPWVSLLQVAGLAVGLLTLIDVSIVWALSQLQGQPAGAYLLRLINQWSPVLIFLVAAGVGAAGVTVLERLFPRIAINTGVLWALVPCLLLLLALTGALPIPTAFMRLDNSSLIGVLLGVFLRGRRYCRY
jgi:hypothetical protein